MYKDILDRIKGARHVFALTGAGVSTLSGIPDFRTDTSGVWDRFDRDVIFNIDVFCRNPALFYEFAREYIFTMKDVKPSEAHFFLAELEKRGLLSGVATQNIDGLHQAAGSKNVYELHGNPNASHCIQCGKEYSMEVTIKRLEGEAWPVCDCGGAIKPDIIFYGENLPEHALNGSINEAMHCDLLLVLGTSLVVYPAASIPHIALQSGAKIIIFNKTPTPLDDDAEMIIREDLGEVCRALMQYLEQAD